MSLLALFFRAWRKILPGAPSPEVASAAQVGTITDPYRPEEFSIFSLARRDGGRIAGLVIERACDGDGWRETNLRSVISVDLATRLGEVTGNDN